MVKHKGFTLLELLIVVGLIGILIAISVTSYGTIQKKSRDSRRISDLKALQNAFEQYNGDHNGIYPTQETDITGSSTVYLPSGIPMDPQSGTKYTVQYDGDGLTYCVCAHLEATTTGGNASDASCTFEAGEYYCVNNLQ